MEYLKQFPDKNGYFGEFGGSFVPEVLQKEMDKITKAYYTISKSHDFINELRSIRYTTAVSFFPSIRGSSIRSMPEASIDLTICSFSRKDRDSFFSSAATRSVMSDVTIVLMLAVLLCLLKNLVLSCIRTGMCCALRRFINTKKPAKTYHKSLRDDQRYD